MILPITGVYLWEGVYSWEGGDTLKFWQILDLCVKKFKKLKVSEEKMGLWVTFYFLKKGAFGWHSIFF